MPHGKVSNIWDGHWLMFIELYGEKKEICVAEPPEMMSCRFLGG